MSLSLKEHMKRLTLVSLVIIVSITQCQRVFVSEWKTNDLILLNCSVCNLAHDVSIYDPSSYPPNRTSKFFATCLADSHDKGTRKCKDQNATQDFSKHTTSFVIGDVATFNLYGIWTCRHGSDEGYLELKPFESKCINTTGDGWVAFAVLLSLNILITTAIIVNIWIRCKKFKHRQGVKDKLEEKINLLERNNKERENDAFKNQLYGESCHTCKEISTCALCVNCKYEYCEICCDAHTKYYPSHIVCQLEHLFTSKQKVYCQNCTGKSAKWFCTICKDILCKGCSDRHKHNVRHMKRIYCESTRRKASAVTGGDKNELELKTKISITKREGQDPVRICGLAFIADRRIVIIDMNNRKLVVYSEAGHIDFEENLHDEPRAMTEMTGNNIAITFGYKMQIRLYEIINNSATLKNTIDIESLKVGKLKPFSISHHSGFLAVEVGECDSGLFVVLDKDGNLVKKILNTENFAYFTGHTIRLALRMLNLNSGSEDGRIYVSGLSKKVVTCIDFRGHILWNTLLPGPRSIILVPDKSASGKNIICSSRGCSAIFRINEENGENDVLLAKGPVRSPRYMNYLSKENLICLQVKSDAEDDSIDEDVLIYKYNMDQNNFSLINENNK